MEEIRRLEDQYEACLDEEEKEKLKEQLQSVFTQPVPMSVYCRSVTVLCSVFVTGILRKSCNLLLLQARPVPFGLCASTGSAEESHAEVYQLQEATSTTGRPNRFPDQAADGAQQTARRYWRRAGEKRGWSVGF